MKQGVDRHDLSAEHVADLMGVTIRAAACCRSPSWSHRTFIISVILVFSIIIIKSSLFSATVFIGNIVRSVNYPDSYARISDTKNMPSAVTPMITDLPCQKSSFGVKLSNVGVTRKIVCFSDFDGTIFLQDTGHVLFDSHGCGTETRKMLSRQIKSGERPFKEVFAEMWGSLNIPLDEAFGVMKTSLRIDPGFQTFHHFCMNNDMPFHVLSAGLEPVLRRVLDYYLGEEESARIDVIANYAEIMPDGSYWKPIWRHECDFGHDKGLSIAEHRDSSSGDSGNPLIVFIGDGISDLPAARHADVLFARKGLYLEKYCLENKIAYIPFDSFADIQTELEKIMVDDHKKTGGYGLPVLFNPSAHSWRLFSNKTAVSLFDTAVPTEEPMLWTEDFAHNTPEDVTAVAAQA